MTSEEEAYAEILRRIREAKETGAVVLILGELSALNRLPRELGRLTSLETLDLSHCEQLSDLSPLAGLTSLQRNLDDYARYRDLAMQRTADKRFAAPVGTLDVDFS